MNAMNWAHIGTTILAAFMASLLEFVEALTVVLAVGLVRGWRSTLVGTAAALFVLFLLVMTLGESLSHIPLPMVQVGIGALLLMFGLRWLQKAILRLANVIPSHDETAIFEEEKATLKKYAQPLVGLWDRTAFVTAFKIVMLEGIEVVFIVIALGADNQLLMPASIGAIIALIAVILLGFCLHRPLSLIPENALKFGVGVLLTAFGTFWVGEGIHLTWPGNNWAIISLIVLYLILSYSLVKFASGRQMKKAKKKPYNASQVPVGIVSQIMGKLLKLFVDDAKLASGAIIWIAINGTFVYFLSFWSFGGCICLVLGLGLLLVESCTKPLEKRE